MTRKSAAIVVAVSLAVLALALLPAAGLAAKGGNGGGNGKPGGSTATLVPSCNPCSAGTVVSFTGSGYSTSYPTAQLDIAGAVTSTAVYADGTISFEWPYFNAPGSYSVKAYQKKGGRMVLKAEVTVVVQ